jgi:hypothetical protein
MDVLVIVSGVSRPVCLFFHPDKAPALNRGFDPQFSHLPAG